MNFDKTMETHLRLSGKQHAALRRHLLHDDKESAAIILCGRRTGEHRTILTAWEIVPVPPEAVVERTPARFHWKTEPLIPVFERAVSEGLSVVKIHSHPGGYEDFSGYDDRADFELFPSIHGSPAGPHASAVMLPDGRIFGRTVSDRGRSTPIDRIMIAGDDILIWDHVPVGHIDSTVVRHAQAFGERTTRLMQGLSVAVVGASGTGTHVIQQLACYQVGRLVLIDPEPGEDVNRNRIPVLTPRDVADRVPKVIVHQRFVEAMGHGTETIAMPLNIADPRAIEAVAECDVAIGCVDSAEGRHILNRTASAYHVPYIDVGVRLIADGKGGIEHICGTVNYLQPDGSSLLSRGLYTMENVRSDMLRRTDPPAYAQLLREKYITGAQESRPAVVSVNGFYASKALLELLARLHPFRDDPNSAYASVCYSLNQETLYAESDGERCPVVTRYAGRGDMRPLLGLTGLVPAHPMPADERRDQRAA